MKKSLFLFALANFVTFCFSKVITGDDNAKDVQINFYGAWGNKCSFNGCTVGFDTLGKFNYGEFKNCYIDNGRSSKNDGKRVNNSYTIDINAYLRCIVNYQVYLVQYAHISGTSKVRLSNLKFDRVLLKQGTNTVTSTNDKKLNITLGNCTNTVYSHFDNEEVKKICDVDNIAFTKNDRCGYINGKNLLCNNKCCSKKGYCGTTNDFCGTGCQLEYGHCAPLNSKISTNGKCGHTNGLKCPNDRPCLSNGTCGEYHSDIHEIGCQYSYGVCNSVLSKINDYKGQTSSDGRCGFVNGYSCPKNQCCSQYGYCGTTTKYCGAGCDKHFGKCN
jgi:hypothetical protein